MISVSSYISMSIPINTLRFRYYSYSWGKLLLPKGVRYFWIYKDFLGIFGMFGDFFLKKCTAFFQSYLPFGCDIRPIMVDISSGFCYYLENVSNLIVYQTFDRERLSATRIHC